MPPSLSSHTPRPLRTKQERLARVYDEEVYPLFGRRFGDLLLAAAGLPPRASVLELGCGAGAVTVELAHRLDPDSRIVALGTSPALLELARAKIGEEHAGRRVFLRGWAPAPKLPFADQAFDLVLANLALLDLPDPAALVPELARVVRPGGRVVVAAALRGSWGEFLDVFRETLVRMGRDEALAALDAYAASLPEARALDRALEAAGLAGVEVELDHWELVFRSAREFLYAPVIEHGPLSRWKEIAGRGAALQETFVAVKEAIDTYFVRRAFAVGVYAGRLAARRPSGS